MIDRVAFNEWWTGRAIPASRAGLIRAMEDRPVLDLPCQPEKCMGEVNFFDNEFSEDVAYSGEDMER